MKAYQVPGKRIAVMPAISAGTCNAGSAKRHRTFYTASILVLLMLGLLAATGSPNIPVQYRCAILVLMLGLLIVTGCNGGSSTGSTTAFSGTTNSTTTRTNTLTASPTSVSSGTGITVTATASLSAATGAVTFYDGSTPLVSGTLIRNGNLDLKHAQRRFAYPDACPGGSGEYSSGTSG